MEILVKSNEALEKLEKLSKLNEDLSKVVKQINKLPIIETSAKSIPNSDGKMAFSLSKTALSYFEIESSMYNLNQITIDFLVKAIEQYGEVDAKISKKLKKYE